MFDDEYVQEEAIDDDAMSLHIVTRVDSHSGQSST